MSEKQNLCANDVEEISGGNFEFRDGPFYFNGSLEEWEAVGKGLYEDFKKKSPHGPGHHGPHRHGSHGHGPHGHGPHGHGPHGFGPGGPHGFGPGGPHGFGPGGPHGFGPGGPGNQ